MPNHQHWLKVIREQLGDGHSAAGDYWNRLSVDWRGVVLHAASIGQPTPLKSELCHYTWKELTDSQMRQLRRGIQRAKNMFGGFGSLREADFRHSTAKKCAIPTRAPTTNGIEMVIARDMVARLAAETNQQG